MKKLIVVSMLSMSTLFCSCSTCNDIPNIARIEELESKLYISEKKLQEIEIFLDFKIYEISKELHKARKEGKECIDIETRFNCYNHVLDFFYYIDLDPNKSVW